MRAQIEMVCKENLKTPDLHRVTFIAKGGGTLVAFCPSNSDMARSEPGKTYQVIVKDTE
jgi:hypothetical protein